MTTGAFQGQPHESGANSIDTILYIFDAKFLINDAALG